MKEQTRNTESIRLFYTSVSLLLSRTPGYCYHLLLIASCIFSILFSRFLIIFTIIILNSFSGSLPISSSFIWTSVFLVCSFICVIFLYLFIFFFFNLLCLRSPFPRLLEKEMATHSSILAWRIPWTEERGRLQSMWSQRATERLHFHFSQASRLNCFFLLVSSLLKLVQWFV